jgi:hypothetical protein
VIFLFYLLPIDELERLLRFRRCRVNAKVTFFVQRMSNSVSPTHEKFIFVSRIVLLNECQSEINQEKDKILEK